MSPRPDRDYYEVLGVAPGAPLAEIKRSYRRLAMQWHPDKNPGDLDSEDRFKEINEAYAVLSDPERRAHYDRFGHAGGPGVSSGGAGFGSVAEVFEGLFSDVFGGRKKRRAGRDLRYTLEVSFEEAAFGCDKTIRFPTRRDCETCDGTGAKQGGLRTCAACHGKGELKAGTGLLNVTRPCSTCAGAGKVVVDACPTCEGAGLRPIEREFSVKVAPGSKDGNVRMVAREGEPGRRGGSPGDLHVLLRVKPHPLFKRDGHDVVCDVPISFTQAALGAQVEVPTLDGKVKMRVPEGTQSGRVFRLRGKGIPREGGAATVRGDQLVRLMVETPTHLSERQRELLEELAHVAGEARSQPRRRRFLERVKVLFE